MRTVRAFVKCLRLSLPAIAAMTFAAAASRVGAEEGITGEWEVRMERDGRETFATLSISKAPEGKLAGKWGSTEVTDLKLDGQKLSFVRTVRFGDQEFRTTYEGTLKDGAIAGTITSERGSYAANAMRKKPRSAALGRWAFSYKIGERDVTAVFAVSEGAGGKLDGKWTSTFSESVVSDVKLAEKKLTFARKVKLPDVQLDTTFTGTIDGDKLTGTIQSERGDVPATAERIGAALAGKWELTTTTDSGTRTSILTVFGDLSGRYELFGSEIPVREIKLDGNDVKFSVEAGFGDRAMTLEVKAKLDGKMLKGEVTSPRGTREISGKKVDATKP